MKKLVFLLPVFLAVALAGCQNNAPATTKTDDTTTSSNSTDKPSDTTQVAEPRKTDANDVGPELRHAGYEYYGLGCMDDLVYDLELNGVFEKGKQTVNYQGLVDGVPTYVINRTGSLSQLGSETLQLKKDGVVLTEASLGKLSEPVIALPADVAVGKTWTVPQKIVRSDGKVLEMTANNKVDKQEKIKVPAGEFDCLHVVTTGTIKFDGKSQPYVADCYYAKTVGTVKLTITSTAEGDKKQTTVVTLNSVEKPGASSDATPDTSADKASK